MIQVPPAVAKCKYSNTATIRGGLTLCVVNNNIYFGQKSIFIHNTIHSKLSVIVTRVNNDLFHKSFQK